MQKLILQLIYSVFVRAFLKIFVGVNFDKARFLLDEKQFIIVANHNSHLDPPVVARVLDVPVDGTGAAVDVLNPATEAVIGSVRSATEAEVAAVARAAA
jgi:1-acyl-sn-glycerol-3-phosphate acyltransferase